MSAPNNNTVNLSLAGYWDSLNPFSAGSIWRSESDLNKSYLNDLKTGGVGAYLSSWAKNALFGWGPIHEANSPLSDTQVSYFGDRAYEDAKRAGANEQQATAARWEVKKFASGINSGNHDASLGGMIENNIPDVPNINNISGIVLMVLLAVGALIVYSEVK